MPHLLLLEDDADIRLGLEQHLKREGFSLSSFESGGEALACIRASGPFAVVLSDMRMPGMDGIQFLTQASACPPIPCGSCSRAMLTSRPASMP